MQIISQAVFRRVGEIPKLTVSFVMSVRQHVTTRLPLDGRIFMKFYIWVFFENLSRKFKVHYDLARKLVPYLKTHIRFSSYLVHFLLDWEMFQIKVVEKMKTHNLCSVTFFPESRAVYKIKWKNIVEPDRPHINPLNTELNPIRHLIALVGAHHILHFSRVRIKIQYGACALHAGYLRL